MQTDITDPLQFLLAVMLGKIKPAQLQMRAAIASARLLCRKPSDRDAGPTRAAGR